MEGTDLDGRKRYIGLSIPKAGTHLLVAIFKGMGYRLYPHPKKRGRRILDGIDPDPALPAYVYGHWRYSADAAARLAGAGFAPLVLLRDPRDICLSMADYLKAGRHPTAHIAEPGLSDLPLADLREGAIRGFDLPNYTSPPISRICEGWLPWADHGALLFRYEDIAARARRGEPFGEVAAIGLDPAAFGRAARDRFRPGGGGDRGGYRWESQFDDRLRDIWRRHASGVAATLGYPEL